MVEFDPYAVLGVSFEAPDFVVQAAYRACIKKYHPDHYKGTDARERTAEILEAYRLIGDPSARARFDSSRGPHHPAGRSTAEEMARNEPKASHSSATATPTAPSANRSSLSVWVIALLLLAAPFLIWEISQGSGSSSNSEQNSNGSVSAQNAETAASVLRTTAADPPLPKLESILSFSNPSDCQMSSATEKLFDDLIIFDPPNYVGHRGPPVRLPGFESELTPSFSRRVDQGQGRNVRDNEATLAVLGTWHGLKVSKLRVRRMEESSFWEYQIRFFEPASHVRSMLNDFGFNLPPVGDFREFTGEDEVSAGIGVEVIPGGSALYCGSSIYY